MNKIKLTEFSHGAGCGCKISPAVLEKILRVDEPEQNFPNLLVGNQSRDDAAVYDLGDGKAIISTTDFFMPIVDDPFEFGGIASVNAISDIYAMGGKPLMAIGILGWPVEKIPAEVANQVLAGAREVCNQAGIPLAGGHSIDSPEPIFGLAVTGCVDKSNIKKNDTAKKGNLIYLTKPLGVGVLSTAHKRGVATEAHFEEAKASMLRLNDAGELFGKAAFVTAMTDVTGFGLLGHLLEICDASNLGAQIRYEHIPLFLSVGSYIDSGCIPGGTLRNWESYGHKIRLSDDNQRNVLADPQTSGGLLVIVKRECQTEFEDLLTQSNIAPFLIGEMTESTFPIIEVS